MERKHKPKMSNDDKQIEENEIFDKIKQKIELKFKNKNKQEKALKRLERLQKYMCEQDSKGLKDIKSKMMNDLTNYYEKGDKKSRVLERLNHSMNIDTEDMKVLDYDTPDMTPTNDYANENTPEDNTKQKDDEDIKGKTINEIEDIIVKILDLPQSKTSSKHISSRVKRLREDLIKEKKLRIEQEELLNKYKREILGFNLLKS